MSASIEPEFEPNRNLEQEILEQTSPESDIHLPIPLSRSVDISVEITEPGSPCYNDCPIIKHVISEIITEKDETVVRTLVRWGNNVREHCSVGPQEETVYRLRKLGRVNEVTCGSYLAKNYKDINTEEVD